jgi:hypothetical protein
MPLTINLGRRRSKVSSHNGAAGHPSLAIGEIGQTVFACPACGRPLAIGVRRCPGCSTRLVMGVQARRASVFVAVGLMVGIGVGGGVASLLSALRLADHDVEVARAAAASALAVVGQVQPSASTAPADPSHAIPTVTIPALSASALSQALVLDARLSASAKDFKSALNAKRFDAPRVSQLLRNASADSVIGLQLAQGLNSWSGGTAVAGQLSTFYGAVQSTAGNGLGASIGNEAAYRRAASAMVALLRELGAIDGQARELATSAGISLPSTSPAP